MTDRIKRLSIVHIHSSGLNCHSKRINPIIQVRGKLRNREWEWDEAEL